MKARHIVSGAGWTNVQGRHLVSVFERKGVVFAVVNWHYNSASNTAAGTTYSPEFCNRSELATWLLGLRNAMRSDRATRSYLAANV